MAHTLTPQQQDMVERIIELSSYATAEEVIAEALRQLEEREQRLIQLRAAIAIGDEAIARGDVVDWTPDFFEQLDREEEGADYSKVTIGEDVRP